MNLREFQRKLQSIQTIERRIKPDPAWVLRTRKTLLMQVANTVSVEPAPVTARVREFYQRFVPAQWMEMLRGPVLAVLSIIVIIAGGSIVSVSAAEQALPGDFFYPIKLVQEQAQLILTKSKTEKLKLKTGFVERRVKEIQAIAASDEPKKNERIKAAAESLRQDLDTVKKQLIDVSNAKDSDESVAHVVEAVKLVDQKSGEVAANLKGVRSSISEDAQNKVTEVETAAVATGVKAVQVLIDSHDHPDAQKLLTTAELSLSIQGKVEGIQDQIASTAQKIMAANPTVAENATGTLAVFNSTSTVVGMDEMDASPTSALRQIKNAQASLDQAKALLQQNKLDEVKDKLGDAAKAVSVAETVADVAINANVAASSSTPFLPAPDSASTSSSSVSVNSSTTPILPAPSTTTTATSSKSIKPDN
jgi:hypothetical protein